MLFPHCSALRCISLDGRGTYIAETYTPDVMGRYAQIKYEKCFLKIKIPGCSDPCGLSICMTDCLLELMQPIGSGRLVERLRVPTHQRALWTTGTASSMGAIARCEAVRPLLCFLWPSCCVAMTLGDPGWSVSGTDLGCSGKYSIG